MSDTKKLIAEARAMLPSQREGGVHAQLFRRLADALEAVTAERDEARAQVVALQAVTPPWVIEAKALEAFVAKVRSELRETAEAGIDLGDDYLRGMRSALLQASAEAARIREENDRD